MADALWFYPVYVLLLLFTLLPLRVQFVISDILYFISYYIVGYRKKTVYENLSKAFPEKSEDEIKRIARNYYHHLCDYLVESLAMLRFSEKEAKRRLTFRNPEVLNDIYKKGNSVLLAFGHYGNWEWLANMQLIFPFQLLAIYKPLKSQYVNSLFITLRERFGLKTVPMALSLRTIVTYNKEKIPTITLVLTDQRPSKDQIEYWTPFLNQETPVQLGIEKIAKKLGFAVVFMKMRKLRRGYYEAEFITLTENPKETRPFEITEMHTRELERQIREKPDYWLWSHKRWKFNRKAVEQWQSENKKYN
jgi:Kdo2-lipid IVA lauroyltransferase/acyltransferase